MPAPNVDLVLVVDASSSMTPCFTAVCDHLDSLLLPMQGQVSRIRFGLVVQRTRQVSLLEGRTMAEYYSPAGAQLQVFTDDPEAVRRSLRAVVVGSNEDSLLGLDVALDFPYGPMANTKRVIVLLSDEPLEGGTSDLSKIAALIDKLMARRVKLFMALPDSDAARELEQADGCEFEAVDGGTGLATVDFARLFDQMGKSISASTLQHTGAEHYQRALFGQDRWP